MQTPSARTARPEPAVPDAMTLLRHFLEARSEWLLATLRLYVCRGGLAGHEGAQEAAVELLTEVVVEAIEHADRFDPARQPAAWVLGIAANLVRRKQVEETRRARRELRLRDLAAETGGGLSDDELFGRYADLVASGPEQEVVADAQARAMLALVPEEDAQVLRLAVVYELNGEELARELGISPGAARVRVHRARGRLRAAYLKAAEGGTL